MNNFLIEISLKEMYSVELKTYPSLIVHVCDVFLETEVLVSLGVGIQNNLNAVSL